MGQTFPQLSLHICNAEGLLNMLYCVNTGSRPQIVLHQVAAGKLTCSWRLSCTLLMSHRCRC